MGTRKLGRDTSHRQAMLRNALVSLFREGRITTTTPRAREIRPLAEKMITLGKRGDLHARRRAARYVQDAAVLQKLFQEIAPAYQERQGGYTRILKMLPRKGDGAEQAILELVE